MSSPSAAGAVRSTTRASGHKLTIVLFTVAASLYWISLYLYMPTLPTYVESKADNLSIVGVVLSMYGLWQMLIRLPLGIVSDWMGRRKPFIIGGLALCGLGAYIMGSADQVNGLLVGRIITGLAAGTWVPLVVLYSSFFAPEDAVRASALLTFVGSGSRVLATGITGSLNQWGGYPLAFFLATGAGALAIVVMLPCREEVRAPKRPELGNILKLISRRDVLLPSLLSALVQYANWAATFGFVPVLARRLGATDINLSVLLSLNLLVTTLGNLLTTTIVKRIGAHRLAIVSFILLAAGLGGAALAPSLPFVFAAQFCIGLSMGIVYPVLMGLSIRHVDDAERSTAMGLHQAVYAIGMFGGPAVSGLLADAVGIRPMFGITAAVCLIIGLLATRWLSPNNGYESVEEPAQ